MANFFNNLSYNVTNAGVTTGVSLGLGYVNSLIDGKDKACRFYYDRESGGVWNIMLKSVVGAGIAYAQKAAIDQLNSWFFGGKSKGLGPGESTQTKLIENANSCEATDSRYIARKYGVMKVNNGKNVVVAVDFCGNWCPDAVMLGIPVKDGVSVSQENIISDQGPGMSRDKKMNNSFTSDTLVWYDPTALVTVQSQKNYILTKVNGRDYSRKELISNGDIEFSITGRINSNLPDVYPTNEIRKFIQIMQYKGLVKINSQIVDQYHIDKIFIKDYSLPQKEGYRNIQEYTINCVGSMPTEEVKVLNDTIIAIDTVIQEASEKAKSPWQQMLSNTVEGLKKSVVSTAASGLSSAGALLNNTL